eukprot:scaffold25_cov342-Pavlova_lutheri.AAC.66
MQTCKKVLGSTSLRRYNAQKGGLRKRNHVDLVRARLTTDQTRTEPYQSGETSDAQRQNEPAPSLRALRGILKSPKTNHERGNTAVGRAHRPHQGVASSNKDAAAQLLGGKLHWTGSPAEFIRNMWHPWAERKRPCAVRSIESATLTQLKRNWALSYLGNLAGTAFVASLTWAAGTIGSAAAIKGACSIATAKVASAFLPMFFKGVLGNWLVCLALWLAISAQSLPGKVLGIFLPISMFVTLGFEHSIANMFFFWQGWFAGADISVLDAVIRNLLPVTLGNIFGGAVLVGLAYQVAYGNNK